MHTINAKFSQSLINCYIKSFKDSLISYHLENISKYYFFLEAKILQTVDTKYLLP